MCICWCTSSIFLDNQYSHTTSWRESLEKLVWYTTNVGLHENRSNWIGETKKYPSQIVANHSRVSVPWQLCQNTNSSIMMRFEDTQSRAYKYSVGISTSIKFCYSLASVLVVLWWWIVEEIFSCAWIDWCLAFSVTKVWNWWYTQL